MPETVVHSRHTQRAKLEKKYPGFAIVDVTSRAEPPWVQLSPFYPHGGLVVPGNPGWEGASVEGVWQGLKVFTSEAVDPARFRITTMKGLKRTVRKYGPCLGHRWGVDGLIGYREARYRIFLPLYRQVLEHRARGVVEQLRELASQQDVVLLDYMTNGDVDDLAKPLSHAGLVKLWLEDAWPGPWSG